MSRRLCAIALIGSAWCAAPCDAGVLYEYTFSGTLFEVNWFGVPEAPYDHLAIGDAWEMTFLVDPEDQNPGSAIGRYNVIEASVLLPEVDRLVTSTSTVIVQTVFDPEILFGFEELPGGGNGGVRFVGLIPDDALPDAAMLESLPFANFSLGLDTFGGSTVLLDGQVDHISLTIVPAPMAWILIVGGFPGMRRRRRSR